MLPDLPDEILLIIVHYLHPKDRICLRQTHPIFRQLIPNYSSTIPKSISHSLKYDLYRILGLPFLNQLLNRKPLEFKYPYVYFAYTEYKKYFDIIRPRPNEIHMIFLHPNPMIHRITKTYGYSSMILTPNRLQVLVPDEDIPLFCYLLYIDLVCMVHKKDKSNVLHYQILNIQPFTPTKIDSPMVETFDLSDDKYNGSIQSFKQKIKSHFIDIEDAIHYLSFT